MHYNHDGHSGVVSLTNLPSRSTLLGYLNGLKADKLALFNINGFWNINHTYGYDVGDSLLRLFAERLERRFIGEHVFHLGGDLFAVLSNHSTKREDFVSALKAALWYFGYSPFHIEGNSFFLSTRIGVAIGVDTLFFGAEFALKQAKQTKREMVIVDAENRHICLPKSQNIKSAIEWETKIRDAIKRDRFVVYAQEIVGGGKKYECLVRMEQADKSIVSPFFFLEHARRANIYAPITHAVIRKSFAYFAEIDAEFSINICLSDILDEQTVDYLYEQMYQYNVADKLIIEIVESDGIDGHEEVLNFVEAMKRQGVRIAIDDFGSGYSNFAYLTKLQADFLKIDGSIVKGVAKDPASRAIVEAIVSFCGRIGIKTIAEFVCNEDIYAVCRDFGVDYFQGYLFHEPTPLIRL